jgi:histidinol dehydrogenase
MALLTRLDLRGVPGDLGSRLRAPQVGRVGPVEAVRAILAAVKGGGDAAVAELTERFDGVVPACLRVPPAEVLAALGSVGPGLRRALQEAAAAIRGFHQAERDAHGGFEHTSEHGVTTREWLVPVGRAG